MTKTNATKGTKGKGKGKTAEQAAAEGAKAAHDILDKDRDLAKAPLAPGKDGKKAAGWGTLGWRRLELLERARSAGAHVHRFAAKYATPVDGNDDIVADIAELDRLATKIILAVEGLPVTWGAPKRTKAEKWVPTAGSTAMLTAEAAAKKTYGGILGPDHVLTVLGPAGETGQVLVRGAGSVVVAVWPKHLRRALSAEVRADAPPAVAAAM